MYERVLVPLDGSAFSEAALLPAQGIASRSALPLELVIVAIPDAVMGGSEEESGRKGDDPREEGRARAERYLAETVERMRAGGFDGELDTSVIPAGNVARSLVRHAGRSPECLVVMTTHGRGAIRRTWLGSTADGVIRRSPVPVLLIRPEPGEELGLAEPRDLSSRPAPFRRILVPLDGSEAAERMLAWAAPLAADEETEFLLFRVVPPLATGTSPYLPHMVREARDHDALEESAKDYLERVGGKVSVGRPGVKVVSAAQPGVEILREAEEWDADVIAMSTEGRGGVARLFLGSVADKVIRGSPTPVLIHRAPED